MWCVARLCDLVPFLQFKKREKQPWRIVTFSNFTKSVTLLKVTLLHGCFSRFLNCTKDTKSRKACHTHVDCLIFCNGQRESEWLIEEVRGNDKNYPCLTYISIPKGKRLKGQTWSIPRWQRWVSITSQSCQALLNNNYSVFSKLCGVFKVTWDIFQKRFQTNPTRQKIL